MKKYISLYIIFIIVLSSRLYGTTYNFGSIGANDSGGSGFATLGNNTYMVITNSMNQDGTDVYPPTSITEITIQADGVNAAYFDVDYLYLKSFGSIEMSTSMQVKFTKNDDTTQTMTLNAAKSMTGSDQNVEDIFDNDTTMPVTQVKKIEITVAFSFVSSDSFNISHIGLSNIVAPSSGPTVTDGNISISGASGTSGAYKIGDTVTATWDNTGSGDNNSDTITGVTVDFSAFGGGGSVSASNSSDTWTATYTITEDGGGSIDSTSLNVSVTATSANGSTTTADTTNATVDNDSPTVTDGNISISGASGSGGAYKIGDTITATWTNTGGDANSDTISTVTADFSYFGGGASVTASESSGVWTATYDIVAGSIDGTLINVAVTVTDNAGNTTTAADSTNATSDNIAPTVTDGNISITSSPSGASSTYIVGDSITVQWTNTGGDANSDTISGVTADFTAFGGGATVAASENSGVWTASYTLVSGSVDGSNLNVSVTASDNAGNTTTTADTSNLTADNTLPTVSSLTTPSDGTTNVAINSNIVIKFSESLDTSVTTGWSIALGTGSLTLTDSNASISYSTTTNSNDTITINPNSDLSNSTTYGDITITGLKDVAGNTMSSHNDSTYDFTTVILPLSFTIETFTTDTLTVKIPVGTNQLTGSGGSFTGALVIMGDNTSDNWVIGSTTTGDNSVSGTIGGDSPFRGVTQDNYLTYGDIAYAEFSSPLSSGDTVTSEMTFTWTGSGVFDPSATNNLVLSWGGSTDQSSTDATPYHGPSITSATYDYSTGILVVTGTNFVSNSGNSNDVDVSLFTFTGEGGATYTLTSATDVEITSATSFSITLSTTDQLGVNSLLNKDGTTSATAGTTYNLAASDNWMAGSPSGNDITDSTGNSITVSNYTAPTITSATYDYSTGALVVTGSNFVSKSGSTNDVDISLLTFTGEGGGTYTLTSSTDIEITSATSFTVTLSGADLTGVESLLNKDGTTSATAGTTYNLAASDNWMAGSPSGNDIADSTGNSITVSNYTAPTITSATYDYSTGALVVTGSNFVSKSGSTNDVDISLLTFTGEGGGTYTLTSSTDIEITSATSFTVTLSGDDKLGINGLLNKDGTTSATAGTTYNLAASDNWMAGSPSGNDITDSTGNSITVSNYTAPTITSATYDYSTGALVVTGSNFVSKSGSTNDVDISLLTFTGEGGGTYTLTSSTDIEITSATSFIVTLSGDDKLGINGLLNKNGTTSATAGTTYNLAASDNWMAGSPSGNDITDSTGNSITVSNYTAPTITSATYDYSTGALVVTGSNFVSKSGSTNDVDISLLTFTGEGGGTYTLTSSTDIEITSATSFTVTLSGDDKLGINGLLNKDGTTSATAGTTYNLAASDNWMAGSPSGNDITDSTGNSITVSNYTAPTITSATYDYSTGALVVTGSNFVSKSGSTNDVDISLLTFTGEGGGTYTLTSSTDIEITSATSFTVTLSGDDKLGINGLLNKNGTTSATAGTTYNLAASDNWMAGSPSGNDIADSTGNSITVSNYTAPTITSATYDYSTGALVVTGSNFVSKSGSTNDVDISLLTFTGEGGGTYTLTSSTDIEITSATSFTVTLSGDDKLGINGLLNKDGTTSATAGTTYNLAASDNWMAGSPSGNDITDSTGNSITVSNYTAPTITSATYDYSTGALVVTGSNFVSKSGSTNDVDISLLTFTGEGGGTYTLTSSTDIEITSATSFTVTLSGDDKLGINGLLNKNGTTSATAGTTYNLAASDNWMAGSPSGNDIADSTGNSITVSNYTAPTITSATYDYSTGALVVTGSNFVSKSGSTNDVDISLLTFTGEGGGTYTLTSSTDIEITSATSFTVTLSGDDKLGINGLLNKDGTTSATAGTTYNLAASDNWMAGSPAGNSIADLTANGITVSNYSNPTITSATYDYSTGVVVVTGSNFVSKSGSANDIDLSLLTFTGEGGTTYTLTSATDVDITSATSFTFTLSGADLTGVESLLNKDGTTSATSGTTYNLAASDNWMAGSPAGNSIADLTANGITVSNYSNPTITSATYDYSTGVVVVTGSNFVSKSGSANDIDLSLLTLTGEGEATYTLTSATDVDITSATSFTFTLSGTDLTEVESLLNKDGTTANSGTTYNLAGADNWMAGSPSGNSIADLTANGITVSNYSNPTITSATYDANTGTLVITGTNFVSNSGSTNDVDVTKLSLSGEDSNSYTLTSSSVEVTSDTEFTVTLNDTDKLNVNGLLNKDGSSSAGNTTYNLSAADNWMAGSPDGNDIADTTGNGVTVSNVQTPTITSATYDASTGALVVTGMNFVKQFGSANDIDLSKLTFKGLSSSTYTLTTATDVEITSATSFTATLSGADKSAIDSLLDINGTQSSNSVTYNLAAADDWNGTITDSSIADTTSAITVSGQISLTSATYNASTGVLEITGNGLTAGDGIDETKLTLTGEGSETYTLIDNDTITATNSTTITITLNATNKDAVNLLLNKDGTSSTGTTTYNLAAASNWNTTSSDESAESTQAVTVSNIQTPTITSATYDANTGTLVITGTNFVKSSGTTNDIAVTSLSLTGQSGNSYTLTSSSVEVTNSTSATITLNDTDKYNVNGLLNKDGTTAVSATTYNLAGAENWMSGHSGTDADLTANGVTVSNVQTPTITSATYDASTGVLTVTGTNLVSTSGSTNDITVSTLTITGEGSGTRTLTTSDVEITSATSFSVTLNAADKSAANLLLNKDGTSSNASTTYNLAAADDWNSVITDVDISDSTNAITVSNIQTPAITSATYDANTGTLVITGTNFVSNSGSTNDVDVTKLSLSGEDSNSYTLTSSSVEVTSDTEFTVTLNDTDKLNVNGLLNKDGSSSAGNTTYNLAGAEDWMTAHSGTDVDATGNGVTVSNVQTPTITSATYDASTGALVVTGTNFVKQFGSANDIDLSKLTFKGLSSSTYTLTTATDVEITSATSFTATLSGADKSAIDSLLDINGTQSSNSVTYNLAAADDWNGTITDSSIADATSAIIVSGQISLTSATYNASTGVLEITGNGLTAGDGIDETKLTLTGEGSETYTLIDNDTITATNSTTITITLNATNKDAVNLLLNKDGTSSTGTTTYNLAAASNWNTTSSDESAESTQAVTVSNIQTPTITSATYDANTGTLVITGTNFVKSSGTTNDIAVTSLSLTGQSGNSYTLTSSSVEVTNSTSATITLNDTDKYNVNGLLNKDGTTAVSATTYNLAGAENWMSGHSGTDADLTANGVTVSNVQTPTITSATYDASTGVLTVTGTNLVSTSGSTNDITVSTLTITGEGSGTRTLTTSDVEITSATSFSVTLNAADKSAANLLLNKDGTSSNASTTYNLAAADDWNSVITDADISDSTNAITVSNIQTPAITSATYDANTGTLVITGTNFVSNSGSTNDVDVTKLSLSGEDSNSYTLTSSSVEVTSDTEFTVTLNDTDKLNVNGLLNKDGSSSAGNTTYNLSAADNWMAGSPDGNDIADTTGNGVTVSNVQTPTITSATYDASTGALVVTGTNFVKQFGSANDIDLSKLTFKGLSSSTYTLTTATDVEITSATSFTATLSGADKSAIDSLLDINGTQSSNSVTYNLAAADDWNGTITDSSIADATSAITVSGQISLTSATYNASTGVLEITGNGLTAGDGIDETKLTLTGEGSETYTLIDNDTITATNSTTITITLNATNKDAVNLLLNKDGTSSTGTTTYNLAAASNWNTTSSDESAESTQAVTVSNIQTPTITSATYDANTGTLVITGTNFVKSSGTTNDIAVTSLSLTGQSGNSYTLTSSSVEVTNSTSATITLNDTDKYNVNGLLNKDGTTAVSATTYNLAGAENWMSGHSGTDADLTANGVTVSNVQTPTITSATYDASTGVLTVTGTNLVSTSGSTNDITVSTLTITGEGSGTRTLTTSDVEITSATSFSVTLNAADKSAANLLLNKDGTSSNASTTYNLAAADDWNSVITDADISDLTVNGITVSNVQTPTITSATYNANTGTLVITGTNFVSNSGSTNDVDVTKLSLSGEDSNSYTLTSSSVEVTSDTEFTVTLNDTDKLNVNGLLNKDGSSSAGNTTYNLAGAEDWMTAHSGTDVDATGNGVTVSNVQTPTITSATYDASTGALVVTGMNFVKQFGSANDIDLSKLTFKGLSSSTYTLTTATDVEITSATSFTATLSGADKSAIDSLLDINGTQSSNSVTYNLAAADDWNGTITDSSIADATSAITVSGQNEEPTISGTPTNITVTEDVASNVDLSAITLADADNDTLTVTLTVDLGTLTASSSGAVTVANSGTVSITLSGTAANINTYLDTASNITYTSASNASGEDQATLTISSNDGTDSLASNPTINIDVTGVDPTVTDANISITSTGSGTSGTYVTGDTITVEWNNTSTGDSNSDTISTVTLDFSAFGGGSAVSATESSGTWTASYTVVSGTIDSTNLNVAITATDDANNTTTRSDSSNLSLDNQDPTVTNANISITSTGSNSGAYIIGDTITAEWNNTNDGNSDISTVTADFSAFGGGSAVSATNNSDTWTASYTVVSGTIDSTNLNIAITATDDASNTTTTSDTSNLSLDNIVATVSNVSVPSDNTYVEGNTLTFTVNTDDNITVTGTPRLTLTIGSETKYATYVSGTGTNALVFEYTIEDSLEDTDGIEILGTIDLNSGTLKDVSGNDLNTTLNSIGTLTNVLVDSTDSTVTDTNILITTTGSGTSGTYVAGDTITVEWNNTSTGDNNSDTINTVTADFSAFGGSSAVSATNNSNTWTASYIIASGNIDSSNLNVAITATDDANNTTTRSDSSNLSLDNQDPTVTNANISITSTGSNSGAYIIGDTITAEWNNTNDGNSDISTVTADFSAFGGGSAISATESSGTWTASYTIVSGTIDSTNLNIAMTATDDASNTTTTSDTSNLSLDNIVATVSSVTVPSNNTYVEGNTLTFTVNTDDNITVTGTPRLTLTIGSETKYATYVSGSGTNALVFEYTIEDSLEDTDGIEILGTIDLNSGTMKDVSGNDLNTTLNSIGTLTSVLVDSTDSTVTDANISITSTGSGTSGTYIAGDTITVEWNNTSTGDNNSDTINTVTADFSAFGGSSAVSATNNSNTWTASYIIASGNIDSSNLNVAITATDDANNTTTRSDSSNLSLDNQDPTVTNANISITSTGSNSGAYIIGDTITAEWNNTNDGNSDISTVTADFSAFGGGSAISATESSGTWTASYTIVSGTIDSTNLNIAMTATDDASNTTTTSDTSNLSLDNIVATVSSVTVPSNNTYVEGNTLTFTVNTDDNITVTGTPRLTLTIGSETKYATYVSGSGTNALVFEYTIEDSLEDTDGIEILGTIDLNSGTMKDVSGNDLNTTLNSIGTLTSVLVDSTDSTVTDANISITSTGSGTSGTYIAGDTITVEWNNTSTGDNNSDTISTVTADFSAFGGGTTVSATNNSDTWTASYTVVSGTIDSTNLNVSITATDDAGNTTTRSDSSNLSLDNQNPTVTDANISITSTGSGTGGIYIAEDTITLSWNNSSTGDNNTDISSVTADFSAFGGGTAITATNNNDTWTASYTVVSGTIDSTNLNIAITATDDASNTTTTSDTSNLSLDNIVATVSSVSVPSDKTYVETETLSFTVNTDDNITVIATPRLTLTIGSETKYATYVSGSGTNALVFEYTIEDSLEDTDGIEILGTIDLNSGTMKDVSGNDLNTTLNSIGTLTNVLVDSVVPASYTVNIVEEYLNSADTKLSFEFTDAEVGATYNYSIDDTDSGTTAVTGSGIIITATDTISDIEVSSLTDDTLTLSVNLTDIHANTGIDVTDTVLKDIIVDSNITLSPVNSGTNVALDANYTMTFNEAMQAKTGNLYIHDASDDSIYDTIDVTSKYVTFDEAKTTITINPYKELETGATYYIKTDSTAFADMYDNYYSISDTSTWKFSTITVPNVTFTMAASHDSDNLEPGHVITYTMNISTTDSDLTDAEITAYIPSDTTYVTESTTVNGTTIADVNNESALKEGYSIGTIIIGTTIPVTYQVTVDSDATSGMIISNQAEVDGTNSQSNAIDTVLSTDVDASSSEESTEVIVGDLAYLTTTTTFEDDDGDDIEAGDTITGTTEIKNKSSVTAENTSVSITIPDNTTLASGITLSASVNALKLSSNVVSISKNISANELSGQISASVQYTQTDNVITFDLGDLSGKSNVKVSYQLKVDDDFDKTKEEKISSTSEIKADNAMKVSDSISMAVTDVPLLEMTTSLLDENGDNAEEGDVLQYLITFNNSGKAMATNIDITNTIPTGVTYVEASTMVNAKSFADDGSIPGTFTGYDLAVGDTLTIKFNVTINSGLSKNETLEFVTSYSSNNSTDDNLSGSGTESIQVAAVAGKLIIEGTAKSEIGNNPEGWIVELASDGVVLTQEKLDTTGSFNFSGISSENDYTVQVRHPETSVSFSKSTVTEQKSGTIVNLSVAMDACGIVYNSVTRTAVKGAKVYITGPDNQLVSEDYLADGQQGQTTGEDGYYNFDIDFTKATAGKYVVSVVSPTGYISTGTSKLIEATIDSDDNGYDPTSKGQPFQVVSNTSVPEVGDDTTYYMAFDLAQGDPDIVNNHIAIDPSEANMLVVTKTSNKKYASVGEFVSYTLKISNTSSQQIDNFTLYDKTPAGFKYIKNTTVITENGTTRKENPNGTRLMSWDNMTLEAGESLIVKYSLVIGAGVTPTKEYVNKAYTKLSDILLSNIGEASVLVTKDKDLEGLMIIGKVYNDLNDNGIQEYGENGVGGIRIISTTGDIITTDEFGRYHLVVSEDKVSRTGYTLVLKLDKRTLPKGSKILTNNPLILKVTSGLMEKANFRLKLAE